MNKQWVLDNLAALVEINNPDQLTILYHDELVVLQEKLGRQIAKQMTVRCISYLLKEVSSLDTPDDTSQKWLDLLCP